MTLQQIFADTWDSGAAPQAQGNGQSPEVYVVSKNLHRRHLNESQRGMIAAKMANLKGRRPIDEKSGSIDTTFGRKQRRGRPEKESKDPLNFQQAADAVGDPSMGLSAKRLNGIDRLYRGLAPSPAIPSTWARTSATLASLMFAWKARYSREIVGFIGLTPSFC